VSPLSGPTTSRPCLRAAKTVGELRMQLETIDPAMKVAAVYFVKIGDRTVARALGISLSRERLNFEKNVVDQGNKEVPYGLALWAHENDGFGPEVLSYLGRAEILATARAGGITDAQWEALCHDIGDRRGLKWEWEKTDEDIKLQIRAAWSKILFPASVAPAEGLER